jgi:two-component sensor histidine kinase
VNLVWTETGGPPVSPPEGRGFGSRLLEAMTSEVGGSGELLFEPQGVVWRLEFPVDTAQER